MLPPEDFVDGPPPEVAEDDRTPVMEGSLGRAQNTPGPEGSQGVHTSSRPTHKRLSTPSEIEQVTVGFDFIEPKIKVMEKFVHLVEQRLGTVNEAIHRVEVGVNASMHAAIKTREKSNGVTTLMSKADVSAEELQQVMKEQTSSIRALSSLASRLNSEDTKENAELEETVGGLQVVDVELSAAQSSVGQKVSNVARKAKTFFTWSHAANELINSNTARLHTVVDKFGVVDGKCGTLVDRLIDLIEKKNVADKEKVELEKMKEQAAENAAAAAALSSGNNASAA